MIRRVTRRLFLALALSSAVLVAAGPAWAGSYLDRAALLLDQGKKEGDMLFPRTHDKELTELVRTLAEVRLRVARRMEVPVAIAKAHPHLLLVLENYERAADAAHQGNFKKFVQHLNAARDEERIFRNVVAELGHAVPSVDKQR